MKKIIIVFTLICTLLGGCADNTKEVLTSLRSDVSLYPVEHATSYLIIGEGINDTTQITIL